ncbi:uncharacterized protein KD926_000309 [Aspergillus affinis]|uniref:uncharacterized protein n=1 Tax=Aspergillus affinis TaxID=1070780 RepID=UPI0022FE3E38|nr:uncharacterized protein KD926_000309 [Aspergillus affinis]KAI9037514.1 hypothetical protein KD926_000309 [Aspergillus affinis]
MSSLTKFTPIPPTANQSRSRSAYFSTKTTSIVIILISIVLFMISRLSFSSFSSPDGLDRRQHQNTNYDLSPDLDTIQIHEPVADDDIGFDLNRDFDSDSEHHDCPYSIPRKEPDVEREQSRWSFSSSAPSSAAASPSASVSTFAASSSGEVWISDFGPLERVHLKLGGLKG